MVRRQCMVIAAATLPALGAEPIPVAQMQWLDTRCAMCHAGEMAQAGIRFDRTEIDWQARESVTRWERVFEAVSSSRMPPPEAPPPPDAERKAFLGWLGDELAEASPPGGTLPRRLNREEYENTVRDLFGMPDFELPDAFPSDGSSHGFDNVGEGLILSPPLLAQLLEIAGGIADEVLPPDDGALVARTKRHVLEMPDFSTTGGGLADAAFRLVSSRNMASAAAWPARFEAAQSGIYRLLVGASAFQTEAMFYEKRTKPFQVAVYARPKGEQVYAPFGEIRKLAAFEIDPAGGDPQRLDIEIELHQGETFGLRWEDGPAFSDPPKREYSVSFLADRLRKDRLHYAAMLAFGGGPRGTTQVQLYEGTRALMESGQLDLSDPRLDRLPEVWGGGLSNAPHNWIKAYVHEEMYRFGPAIDLTRAEVEGPLRLVEDNATRARTERARRFLGERDPSTTDTEHAEAVMRRFLSRAFRRPATEDQVKTYTSLAVRHLEQTPGARLEDGLHLAVRRTLVSPHFLYRSLSPGRLDEFDLASRLSYFLTSSPPDESLAELARAGRLSEPAALRRETERLLRDPRSDRFVRSFTGQWLSTRLLRGIMPDPRLLQFGEADRRAMIDEAELFFADILRENRPIETFIDPDFSYRNARLNKIYGGNLEGNEMRRVELERGGRHGGVLGLAAVMMATANGVDTNPILRGVWLLENVFGKPAPETPPDVPAIAPDTSGARSMREQLLRHRADPSCARCHNSIDPLGLVLESFDPVGRWRSHYPRYTKPPDGAEELTEEFYSTVGKGAAQGPPVDPTGLLEDGTRLRDVTDLKRYLVERIDLVSLCLAEKLLVYATGRPLSFGDRRVAGRIVDSVAAKGNGFRDLVVEVVQSESFATK